MESVVNSYIVFQNLWEELKDITNDSEALACIVGVQAWLEKFKLLFGLLGRQNPKKIFLFDRANWDVIREEMNEVCENYLTLNFSSILTVEENWQYFCSHYTCIIDAHIPCKHLSTRYHIPWLSTSLMHTIRKKQQVYNKAKLSNNNNDWLEYKMLQKQVKGTA